MTAPPASVDRDLPVLGYVTLLNWHAPPLSAIDIASSSCKLFAKTGDR
jgi:hypothetical protein